MQDWTSGYVADIGYTYGYYGELNPLLIKLAFATCGYIYPQVSNACELGFGQGMSINIHASASDITWSGNDFNPAQAGFAQELSNLSENKAQLLDESFAQYCKRDDLPEFDYIGLHGIWSWISDENRSIIVDFIARKLKVGGVLYVSYNTQPGWAPIIPIRHLMTEHAQVMGASGQGIANRINSAIEFTDRLINTNPFFTRANPIAVEEFEKLKKHDRNYLAHEYFNQDWVPMPFSKMAQWLSPTKLQYVCSANYSDQVEVLNLTNEQQALLAEIADPIFRQTVRDFMIGTRFRKDYWVKGARKMTPLEQIEILSQQKVVLVKPRADIVLKTTGIVGEVTLNEAVYNPILDILADYQVKSLGDLERLLKSKAIELTQIVQAVMILNSIGALVPAQDQASEAKAKGVTYKLNAAIMNKSRSTSEISFLASPITGGGIVVSRFAQLFLMAISNGDKTPQEWAQYVWDILASQGQKILKDGKALATPQENLDELLRQANTFAEKQIPVFKALGIIDMDQNK